MSYIVLFSDNEEHAEKRQQFMSEHLQFLEKNSDVVKAAGPLFSGMDGTESGGGLWIMNTQSIDKVKELVQADPFYHTGLRKEIDIRRWKVVFGTVETEASVYE